MLYLMENILTDYVSECAGNGNYIFETKQQYNDFLKRLESLDDITDTNLRYLASEILREKLLLNMHQEIPYNLIVSTETWKEKKKVGKWLIKWT